MFSSLTRRGRIRALSFLTALILLLSVSLFGAKAENIRLRRSVSNSYARAFSELTASLDQMDTALRKGQYVTTSSMLCTLCSQVYAQSQTAQMALGQLPLANIELEQTAEFLAQVGDYALALSRSAGRSGVYEEEAHTDWTELAAAARTLSGRLRELELSLIDGRFTIGDIEAAEARLSAETESEGASAPSGDSFQALEAEFPHTPSLIYDGPFSQHLTDREAAMLEGEEELTPRQAAQRLGALLGERDFTYTGMVEGDIPAYTFTCQAELGLCTVNLTRQGGRLLSFVTEGLPARQLLTVEDGLEAAEALLDSLGYEDMEERYYQLRNNILTVNFCYEQEDVLCYPDLVKVSVSMEDGSPLGYEGQGYLVNHRSRRLEPPAVSEEEARTALSPLLTVEESDLALIPTPGEHEVLCHEFLCRTEEGERVLVYLNAQTGGEEKLLLLLEDEHGTLTL